MNLENQSTKPWRNKDGTLKCDKEIRHISKTWSASQWEDYLKRYEYEQQEETLHDPLQVEEVSTADYITNLLEHGSKNEKTFTEAAVRKELSQLTFKERQILILIYWNEKNITDVSLQLKITKNAARLRLFKALKKLEKRIIGKVTRDNSNDLSHQKSI